MNKFVFVVLSSMLVSCSVPNQDKTIVEKLRQDGVISKDTNKVYLAEVSNQKGASFSFILNESNFTTKANTNGTLAKTNADITNYKVYLIKNASTTGYPAGGDPITDKVAGPFTIAKTGTSQTITFTNVLSSGADAYYVAAEALDAGNNNIVKPNNGGVAWSGSSANVGLGVSSGSGIVVNATLQVSSTTPLSLTLNLLDTVGAKIETTVSSNAGSSTVAVSAF